VSAEELANAAKMYYDKTSLILETAEKEGQTVDKLRRLQSLQALLAQLEATNGRDERSSKKRKALTKQAIDEMEQIPMGRAEVAERLHLNPVTVERWAKEVAIPRTSQVEQLRRIVEVEIEIQQAQEENPRRAKLPLLKFDTTDHIGVYSAVDYFFDRVAGESRTELYVENVWVLRSVMGFHAGTEDRTVEHLADLFKRHDNLRINYVYPVMAEATRELPASMQTEAYRSFKRMVKEPSLKKWYEKGHIIAKEILRTGPNAQNMEWEMFAHCSYFVLNYSEAGQERYGRIRDILVELPCQRYTEAGKFADPSTKYLFVELPKVVVSDLWERWEDKLKALPPPPAGGED